MASVASIPLLILIMGALMSVLGALQCLCRKGCKPEDKKRFKNKMFLMSAICMYLLYPDVLMNLFAATSCFRSIASEPK